MLKFLSPGLRVLAYTPLLCVLTAGCGSSEDPSKPGSPNIEMRQEANAQAGRRLFVEKGCVTCHAINGVGGKVASALDAQTELDAIDVADFSARMWRGAAAMVELQSLELGYTIWLEGDDLVNLAAFAADATEQKKLSLEDIPEGLRDAFLNERFWEVEDWDEFLEQGQEGYGEPVEPGDDTPN